MLLRLLSFLGTFPIFSIESERVTLLLRSEERSQEFQSSLAEVETNELFKECFIINGFELSPKLECLHAFPSGLLLATLSTMLLTMDVSSGSK